MSTETPDRFFDLAMMKIAGQSSDAELSELEKLLAQEPGLKEEYEQLAQESRLLNELIPMAKATQATEGEFPEWARPNLQLEVKEAFSRPLEEEGPITSLLIEARRLLAEVETVLRVRERLKEETKVRVDRPLPTQNYQAGCEVQACEAPAIEEEISPLVMNTWFHNLGEAIDHPKAVVTLDIIHQESMDRLGVLSEFPHLKELHFIKVNIDNFKGLIPVSKLCHIKFESCEVNGWMGLLDLQGLKKVGCYPGAPPEKVKRLLEDNGVEIYLFTPMRINDSGVSGAPESVPKTQVIYEEAIA